MPSGLAGFLDLRGTAIPIVRLDRLFDLPERQPGLHTPMIVLRGVLGPIGILVNSVRGIVAGYVRLQIFGLSPRTGLSKVAPRPP